MFRLDRLNVLCLNSRCNNVVFKNAIRFARTTKHKNYYEILGLKSDCTNDEIRASFAKLSKEHHPDTSKGVGDPVRFQNIVEAYRVLSKEDSRARFDAMHTRNRQQWQYDDTSRVDYRDFGRHQEQQNSDYVYEAMRARTQAREKFYEDKWNKQFASQSAPKLPKHNAKLIIKFGVLAIFVLFGLIMFTENVKNRRRGGLTRAEFEQLLEEDRVREALAKAGIHRNNIDKADDEFIGMVADDDDEFFPQTDDGDKYR